MLNFFNSEEEVPYFRLYHNFLPFPEHYSEQDRRLLAYQSTLLTQALNSHHHDGNSPNSYQHYAYAAQQQSRHLGAAGADGKSRLRQQLMQKRKLSGAVSQAGETPSKMQLVRRSSEDVIGHNLAAQYQHRPLHHSNSYPIDPQVGHHFHPSYPHFHHYAAHHHVPVAHPGAAESFMAQLHPHHAHHHPDHQSYLLDGGYTTLAPVAPDALHGFMTSHQHHVTSQMHSNQNNNHPYYRPPLTAADPGDYYHPGQEGRSPRQLVQSNQGGNSPPSPKRRRSGVQSTSPSTAGFRFAGNSPKPTHQQRRSSEKQGGYQLQYSIATPQVGSLGAYHTAAAAAYYAQAAANVAAGSQSAAEDSYHLANQGSTDWFRKLNNNMGMMVCIVCVQINNHFNFNYLYK